MRLSDIGDWFALRRRLARPWEFLRLRKRPLPGGSYDVPFRDGGSVRIRDVPMDRHIFHRIFARDEYRLEGTAPGAFDTVVDIGAHIGLFAVRAAPLARRVISFEPDRANYELLLENTRRFPHVSAQRAAVAGRRGAATLFVSDNPSAHSMHPAEAGRRVAGVEVETVPLADVFEEHAIERCDFLKLDCEGAEYEILYAAPPALWKRIDRVALEYHPVAGGAEDWTGERLARHLTEMGHDARLHPSRKDPAKGHLFSRRR